MEKSSNRRQIIAVVGAHVGLHSTLIEAELKAKNADVIIVQDINEIKKEDIDIPKLPKIIEHLPEADYMPYIQPNGYVKSARNIRREKERKLKKGK